MSVWRGHDNGMMLCKLESNLGMPLPSGQLSARGPGCTHCWVHTGKGSHCPDLAHSPSAFWIRTVVASDQRPPWRPQTVGGAHRAPTQCKLCIPFYLPDTAGNFKGFPARGRLLGKKAISRAQLGGGHREGKNPGCGDPPGEVWVVIWRTESIHGPHGP